jgi:hypothetical protein
MIAAERLALQLRPRRAAQDDVKKSTISRAEGGQLQALVRLPLAQPLLDGIIVYGFIEYTSTFLYSARTK